MISSNYSTMNDSLLRSIQGQVELYDGSTLIETFLPNGSLQEITVARTGEKGKFFGFGICQQATVKIVDKLGAIQVSKGNKLKISFRADNSGDYERVCPTFIVKDVARDEKTNVITVTSYDTLESSVSRLISEIELILPYTIKTVVEQISNALGISVNITDSAFDTSYEDGANLSGEETIRSVLNAIAEVTQTIYYIDQNDTLIFKRLDRTGVPLLDIEKKDYFELSTSIPVTITRIMHVTELGDNVDYGDTSGVIQYIRDNPFWNNREDLQELLPIAEERIHGLTIVPYNLKWRGNFLTEIGDKVSIETKDGSFINTFILDDSFSYTGGFNQTGSWEYNPESDRSTVSNPATIGDKLNQTFARVDKVNKTVSILASETEINKSAISALEINTESITSSVSQIESSLNDNIEGINDELTSIKKEVESKITESELNIKISEEITKGVNSIVTDTGYKFDADGLTVSKTNSEMSTTITEDGMTVAKNDETVLTANNVGVIARNLHAETYLIIGKNSRLEDFIKDGENRTACFWIGG